MEHEKLMQAAEKGIPFYTAQLKHRRELLERSKSAQKALLKINSDSDISQLVELEKQLQFNSILNISLIELLVILKHFILSEQEWEKSFFLKHIYLTVHETVIKYDAQNQNLYQLSQRFPVVEVDYKQLGAAVKQFKKDFNYPETFSKIRNSVAAHIDADIEIYYDTLVSIQQAQVFLMATKFVNILTALLKLSSTIIELEGQQASKTSETIDQEIAIWNSKIEELFANEKIIPNPETNNEK